jgi:hypothetical protein
VMLELILIRSQERQLVQQAQDLGFLVSVRKDSC